MRKTKQEFTLLLLFLLTATIGCNTQTSSSSTSPDIILPTLASTAVLPSNSDGDAIQSDVPATIEPDRHPFQPGDPTATPPGEAIRDSNYISGKTAFQANDYEEVLRLMTLVIEEDPNVAPAYWHRGMAYFYLNNYQAGIVEMERALELDPDYALAYADRGVLHLSMGNTDAAVTDLYKALELDPSLAKVHHNLAHYAEMSGNFETAVAEYQLSLSIDSTRSFTWGNMARLYADLGDYQNCADSAEQAVFYQTEQTEMWIDYYNWGTCLTLVSAKSE